VTVVGTGAGTFTAAALEPVVLKSAIIAPMSTTTTTPITSETA
jgi:hypothetical protein